MLLRADFPNVSDDATATARLPAHRRPAQSTVRAMKGERPMRHAKSLAVTGALLLAAHLGFGTSKAEAQMVQPGYAPRYYYPYSTTPNAYGYYYGAPVARPYAAPYRAPVYATPRNDYVGGHNRDYTRGWDLPLAKPWLKPLR
jgi:hypothetical protein